MYQIFVVEDELLIRQSIRNTIEHMQGPFSFCGEASDGEMALSLMQDLMPDILLTDIRMPFLDGFGLIQHLKSIMAKLKKTHGVLSVERSGAEQRRAADNSNRPSQYG